MDQSQIKLPIPPPFPFHLNPRFLMMYQKSGSNNKIKSNSVNTLNNNAVNNSWNRLFDEGYRADVKILTEGGVLIYAHASILGVCSPVLNHMLKKSKPQGRYNRRTISILGVPSDAVRVFIRFLYSSCYDEEDMNEFALPLLVLSHTYVVPQLKRLCESYLEKRLVTTDNAIDIFQLSLLCDAPRLSLLVHRFILLNFKSVSTSEGWNAMKESHRALEKEILESMVYEELRQKERARKLKDRQVYVQLYEAMEALVHICKDGCRTIGPHDKILRVDQEPCHYTACKGLEALIRHFYVCKMRGISGCIHCKRMWQILELHSRLCAHSDTCKVPLCRNLRQRTRKQTKKEETRWRLLVKKIVRSNSITGAPFFSLET